MKHLRQVKVFEHLLDSLERVLVEPDWTRVSDLQDRFWVAIDAAGEDDGCVWQTVLNFSNDLFIVLNAIVDRIEPTLNWTRPEKISELWAVVDNKKLFLTDRTEALTQIVIKMATFTPVSVEDEVIV
ncbi:MAG TPA: hypothetical protein VLI92_02800 [Candidatus Saccharimonadales bacterium]|nr:hypothetical protein [Candidatus Saccharimonadales bacterium]